MTNMQLPHTAIAFGIPAELMQEFPDALPNICVTAVTTLWLTTVIVTTNPDTDEISIRLEGPFFMSWNEFIVEGYATNTALATSSRYYKTSGTLPMEVVFTRQEWNKGIKEGMKTLVPVRLDMEIPELDFSTTIMDILFRLANEASKQDKHIIRREILDFIDTVLPRQEKLINAAEELQAYLGETIYCSILNQGLYANVIIQQIHKGDHDNPEPSVTLQVLDAPNRYPNPMRIEISQLIHWKT